MHEGQIEKFTQGRIDPGVDAAVDGPPRHAKRQRVAGIGSRMAAKHVAGKLVEHNDERERTVVTRFPRGQLAGDGSLPNAQIPRTHFHVEIVVARVPAIWTGIAPESQNAGWRDVR